MPLSDVQRAQLEKAHRRLAIVGRFNAEPDAPDVVLMSARPQGEGPRPQAVSGATLFTAVRPEIRAAVRDTRTIGTEQYNAYKLGTPLTLPDGKPIPLLRDSPLFDESYGAAANSWKTMQQKGGELFQKLLGALDSLAHFAHGNFNKALLKLAKNYLPLAANAPNINLWYTAVGEDPLLAGVLVKYLTCYSTDDRSTESEVRKRIAAVQMAGYGSDHVDALVAALVSLKRLLLARAEDATLTQLRTQVDFKEPTKWLDDYPSSDEYGLKVPGVNDTTFFAYYGYYMAASKEVHRIVRSGPLHSYLLCWLWSKYRAHDNGATFQDARDDVFRVGVEAQPERVPAEDREARKRNDDLIRKAAVELGVSAEEAKRILNDEGYKTHATIVLDRLMAALRGRRCFTRAELALRATNLFVTIGQLAGGKVSELHATTDAVRERLLKYYRKIMNLKEAEGVAFDAAFFKSALEALCVDDGTLKESAVVAATFAHDLGGMTGHALRMAVKEAFITEYARTCKSTFGALWAKNVGQIEAQKANLERLYRMRLDGEVDASATSGGAGRPLTIVTLKGMPDVAKDDARLSKEERKRRRTKSARTYVGAQPTSRTLKRITAPVPVALEKEFPVGASGRIVVDGRTAATVERRQQLIFDIERPDDLTAAEAKLEVNGREIEVSGEKATVIKLGIPELASVAEDAELRGVAPTEDLYENCFDELTDLQNAVHQKYKAASADEALQKKQRALLLSEHIAAAPVESVSLDRDDVSCALGLMIDMVEHLGALGPGDRLFRAEPTHHPAVQLDKINVSRYFPVADKDQLATVMLWAYDQGHEVQKLQGYLREVQEVVRFLDHVGASLDVLFINRSVADHVAACAEGARLWPADPHVQAAAMYLTEHGCWPMADPRPTWAALETTYRDTFLGDPNSKALICPVAFSPVALKGDVLPVISPGNLAGLPELYPPGAPATSTDRAVEVDPWIQRSGFLLVAAAFLDPSLKLGSVVRVTPQANVAITRSLGLERNQGLVVGQAIGAFLALVVSRHPVLGSNWVLSRWTSLALVGRYAPAGADDWRLPSDFGNRIVELSAHAPDLLALLGPWFRRLQALDVVARTGPNMVPVKTSKTQVAITGSLGSQGSEGQFQFKELDGVEWRNGLATVQGGQ